MCVCVFVCERERDIGLCVIARVGECAGVNVSDGGLRVSVNGYVRVWVGV